MWKEVHLREFTFRCMSGSVFLGKQDWKGFQSKRAKLNFQLRIESNKVWSKDWFKNGSWWKILIKKQRYRSAMHVMLALKKIRFYHPHLKFLLSLWPGVCWKLVLNTQFFPKINFRRIPHKRNREKKFRKKLRKNYHWRKILEPKIFQPKNLKDHI